MSAQGTDLIPILTTLVPGINTCALPLYPSCIRGKGMLTSVHSNQLTPNQTHTYVIKKGELKPGMSVSTNQYEYRVRGRLHHTKEKEDPLKIYGGGTLFVDHTSGLIRIYNQVSLGALDTLRSKHLFELEGEVAGHTICHYHGDNGVYKSKEFKDDLATRHQVIAYSGVGVHGQNGVVERAIQTVVSSARTMILHQALLWPEYSDMILWPFVIDHAAHLWNLLPCDLLPDNLTLIEVWSSTKQEVSPLRTEKV